MDNGMSIEEFQIKLIELRKVFVLMEKYLNQKDNHINNKKLMRRDNLLKLIFISFLVSIGATIVYVILFRFLYKISFLQNYIRDLSAMGYFLSLASGILYFKHKNNQSEEWINSYDSTLEEIDKKIDTLLNVNAKLMSGKGLFCPHKEYLNKYRRKS